MNQLYLFWCNAFNIIDHKLLVHVGELAVNIELKVCYHVHFSNDEHTLFADGTVLSFINSKKMQSKLSINLQVGKME